jgi:hypothetical protein
MNKKHTLPAILIVTSALTGCLVPEKFAASITIKPDGSYNYKYDGTVKNVLAVQAIKAKGSLSSKDEAQLKADVEKGAKSKGIKKLNYLGEGRYELIMDQELALGQQTEIMPVVTVKKAKDDVITIAATELKQKDREAMDQMGIKIEGMVEVRLPSNAQVITHNASGTPGLFNKAYAWKVGSLGQALNITFKLGK